MLKKKIAFLTSSLDNGGAQRAVSNISMGLNQEKYDITIIVFDGNNISYDYSGELINLNIPASRNLIKKLFNFVKRYHRIKKLKKKNHFDYVVSFLSTPNILNVLTNVKKTKNVISIRNFDSLKRKSLLYRIIYIFEMKLYEKAHKIIAVSDSIKTELKDRKKLYEKTIVINNGFPISQIKLKSNEPIDQKYIPIFSKPNIINVGRLTYQKGQWLLIEATRRIVKNIPNFQLVIIGEGELKSELENQINQYKLNENVTIIEFDANPFKYIAKSNIFVLSSLYEGFPNVLVEAMACGVPVIATDCLSGPREILAPNYLYGQMIDYSQLGEFGILINRPSQSDSIDDNKILLENLIEKIQILLKDDKSKYFALNAKKRADDFAIRKVITIWKDLLN